MLKQENKATVKLLRNISIFEGLTESDLESLLPLLKPAMYPPESVIIREGTEGNSMYVIVDGEVRVSRKRGPDDEIILSLLSAGNYFGELALIDTLPRSADVTSNTETEVLVLSREDLDGLLEKNMALANIFYRNCLTETFSRLRSQLSNVTLARFDLHRKSAILDDLNMDLSHARAVQNYFIDQAFLEGNQEILPGIRQSYIYHPSIDVGGDFLNILRINDHMAAVIIADVEGHGISASLATGVLKSALSLLMDSFGTRPVQLLEMLNVHFHKVIPNLYATCYCALIDSEARTVRLAKAGHHHPLFWRQSTRDFASIKCSGTGLGIFMETSITEELYEFRHGDRLLFFTDGIIEQFNAKKEMFGKNRLQRSFRKYILKGEASITGKLLDDLGKFSGSDRFDDDVTLLLLEF
jgi:serine phosphatase RsbU (regulator of sigma subunit)